MRQGFANLHRPNNRTVLLLLSLGLGTFLVLTLFLVRTTLLREIRGSGGEGRPNLVFFDIQDDQIGPLERTAAAAGSPVTERAPIVTMKISSVKGMSVEKLLEDKAARAPAWALRREYRSTFRGRLSETEKVVEGVFTGRADPAAGPVPVSVEEGLARDMQLHLGDEIDWDVQGLAVRTRVGSIRAVEWRRMEPNFFVVFPEGVLEGGAEDLRRGDARGLAGRLGAGAARGGGRVPQRDRDRPGAGRRDARRDLLEGGVRRAVHGPLHGRDGPRRARRARSSRAATSGSARPCSCGRWARPAAQVALIQLVEYAVLGIQAAVVGALLAVAGNALLARYVFHIGASASAGQIGAAVVAVAALAVATGFIAGRGIVDHPPLEILRQET